MYPNKSEHPLQVRHAAIPIFCIVLSPSHAHTLDTEPMSEPLAAKSESSCSDRYLQKGGSSDPNLSLKCERAPAAKAPESRPVLLCHP